MLSVTQIATEPGYSNPGDFTYRNRQTTYVHFQDRSWQPNAMAVYVKGSRMLPLKEGAA